MPALPTTAYPAGALPWVTQAVQPYADQLGIPAIAPHVPTVVLSLTSWVTIQYLSAVLSPKLFPKRFAKFDRRTRVNWDIHVVSFVHAAIVTPAAAAIWWQVQQSGGLAAKNHPLAIDRLRGYDYEAGQVYAIALG